MRPFASASRTPASNCKERPSRACRSRVPIRSIHSVATRGSGPVGSGVGRGEHQSRRPRPPAVTMPTCPRSPGTGPLTGYPHRLKAQPRAAWGSPPPIVESWPRTTALRSCGERCASRFGRFQSGGNQRVRRPRSKASTIAVATLGSTGGRPYSSQHGGFSRSAVNASRPRCSSRTS